MTDLLTLAGALYSFVVLVFMTNCTLELSDRGQTPGALTLLASVLWPFTTILVITMSMLVRLHR